MKSSKDILFSVLKTAQMGQVGIRCIQKYPGDPALKNALTSQLREYDAIEQEVFSMAQARGWKANALNPSIETMVSLCARTSLIPDARDSKIAAMMIWGNTRGMIKSLKNWHKYDRSDGQIASIALKLLDCEKENIRQMERFV